MSSSNTNTARIPRRLIWTNSVCLTLGFLGLLSAAILIIGVLSLGAPQDFGNELNLASRHASGQLTKQTVQGFGAHLLLLAALNCCVAIVLIVCSLGAKKLRKTVLPDFRKVLFVAISYSLLRIGFLLWVLLELFNSYARLPEASPHFVGLKKSVDLIGNSQLYAMLATVPQILFSLILIGFYWSAARYLGRKSVQAFFR